METTAFGTFRESRPAERAYRYRGPVRQCIPGDKGELPGSARSSVAREDRCLFTAITGTEGGALDATAVFMEDTDLFLVPFLEGCNSLPDMQGYYTG